MPVKETDLQTELKDAAIAAGGYSYKQSHKFLIGVLDLFVQLPGSPTVILEVKYEKKPRKDGTVPVALTPHQIRSINSINKSGGVAGWVVLTRRGPGEYGWSAGRHPPPGNVPHAPTCGHVKKRGQPWPIEAIIKTILSIDWREQC